MKEFFKRMLINILPIIGMALFVIIFICGLIFFSYLILIIAIVGFILFAIGYIRARILLYRFAKDQKKSQPGRTIDHDKNQT